jgi:hypothetical protein
MKNEIQEPTGCLCCGQESDGFQVCCDCGTQMFIGGLEAMHYCQKHNPERFNMLIDWYNKNYKTHNHEQ